MKQMTDNADKALNRAVCLGKANHPEFVINHYGTIMKRVVNAINNRAYQSIDYTGKWPPTPPRKPFLADNPVPTQLYKLDKPLKVKKELQEDLKFPANLCKVGVRYLVVVSFRDPETGHYETMGFSSDAKGEVQYAEPMAYSRLQDDESENDAVKSFLKNHGYFVDHKIQTVQVTDQKSLVAGLTQSESIEISDYQGDIQIGENVAVRSIIIRGKVSGNIVITGMVTGAIWIQESGSVGSIRVEKKGELNDLVISGKIRTFHVSGNGRVKKLILSETSRVASNIKITGNAVVQSCFIGGQCKGRVLIEEQALVHEMKVPGTVQGGFMVLGTALDGPIDSLEVNNKRKRDRYDKNENQRSIVITK